MPGICQWPPPHCEKWPSDFAEVVPRLYVGAHPEPESAFDFGADVVVCLTANPAIPSPHSGRLLVHWPIKDGPVPRPEILRSVAGLIDTFLKQGAVVYVHCQAGMNRSALVVGRVLMAQGMTADEAIALVRDRRKGSLSDEYAEWLRSDENGFGKTALQGGGTTTSV